MSFEDRIKDQEWSKLCLERDKNKCRICGRYTKMVHHVVPRVYQDTRWDIENGVSLCFEHHRAVHDDYDFKEEVFEPLFGLDKLQQLKDKAGAL